MVVRKSNPIFRSEFTRIFIETLIEIRLNHSTPIISHENYEIRLNSVQKINEHSQRIR